MSKGYKIILFISLAINVVLSLKILTNSDFKKEEIDSLESELVIIKEHRDEVKKEIDTVYIQLKEIQKEYVETHNGIISNSPGDDYNFFVDYLERNSTRLDSIYHF